VEERSNDVMKADRVGGHHRRADLVTGFVGMNVKFPMEGTTAGFWLYLAVMVAAALVLYVVLKLRNWL
jgi:Mg2+ and Co2+ transporter CorA